MNKYTGILAVLLLASTASAEDNVRFITAEVKVVFIPAEGIKHERIEYTTSYTSDISKTADVKLPDELVRRGWKCVRSAYHSDDSMNFRCIHEKNLFIFADSAITKTVFQSAWTHGMFTEAFEDGIATVMFGTSVSKVPTGIRNEVRIVLPAKKK
jgi:hypothetical protein